MLRSRSNREPGGLDETKKERKIKSRKTVNSGKGDLSPLAVTMKLLFSGFVVFIAIFLLFSGFVVFKGLSTFPAVGTDDAERELKTANLELSQPNQMKPPIYDLTIPDIYGTPTHLQQYNGFVTLVVNVACA